MINNCKENLEEIKKAISLINEDQYTYKSNTLSNATVGQHIRHILEFYFCLLNGLDRGIVNYDQRARNMNLENNPKYAKQFIDEICSKITLINTEVTLELSGNFSSHDEQYKSMKTSVNRELAYCLEHSIHHQALIKIGLMEQGLDHLISINWGVAQSTIKYKNSLDSIEY